MSYVTSHLLSVGHAKVVHDDAIRAAESECVKMNVRDFHPLVLAAGASTGWKLRDDGTGRCERNDSYKLLKYSVTAGQYIRVSSAYHWQFQNDLNVPESNPNTGRIGPTYDAGEFAMKVPSGATYLIVSQLANDTSTRAHKAIMPEGTFQVLYNSVAGGVYIDGDSIVTNAKGFCVQIDGDNYYIAPTDQVTSYKFTAPYRDNGYFLMIDTSKLTARNARNDPDTVLKIVQRDDYAPGQMYIPIAFYFKGFWKFIGPFAYFEQRKPRQFDPQLTAKFQFGAHGINTITALETAAAAGFKYIECDVAFTSDGVAVMNHDSTITVDGTTYTINQKTYEDLKEAYDALATLDELVIAAKKADLCIEIDTTHIGLNATRAGNIYGIVKQRGMLGATMFTCDVDVAQNLLSYDFDIAIALSGMTSTSAIDGIADIAHMAGVTMLSCTFASLTEALVKYAHNAGCRIRTWMVETDANLATAQGYGVDGILTEGLTP